MDLRLPLLADANLHLGIAEEALREGSLLLARQEMEKAERSLAELADLPKEGLLLAMMRPLEDRLASLSEELKPARFEEGEPEADPEEDVEPSA